jgi:hypothetical protein
MSLYQFNGQVYNMDYLVQARNYPAFNDRAEEYQLNILGSPDNPITLNDPAEVKAFAEYLKGHVRPLVTPPCP